MNNCIQFGIVGCGMIAYYHALAIQECPRAVLAGACSHTLTHAQALAEKFHVKTYFTYQEMLADKNNDAIVICTPSGDHFQQARLALLAGKHVVVEKPMCLSLREADELIELADVQKREVCVISQSRFSDAMQAVRKAVDTNAFGRMISASLSMHYERKQEYYDQDAWRGTLRGDGGGVLMNQGIHGIDALCYIMGQPVSVCGYTRTMLRKIEVEDTAIGMVAFSNGSIASIDATVCSHPSFSKRFVFCGEKGTVILEEDAITVWSLPEPCPIPLGSFSGQSAASNPRGISHRYHEREYLNLLAHLCDGNPLLLDARQGRIPLSIILGIYESAQKGIFVSLKEGKLKT